MKTEIKKFSMRNVGSTWQYKRGGQHLNNIIELSNQETVSAEEVKKFFLNCFTSVDENFFEVFDMNVVAFKKINLQSYYLKDDFLECIDWRNSIFYRGIDQKTFIAFIKKHEIYFEFSLSQIYCFCKNYFNQFCSWGGSSGFLARGKDGLYWVSFGINYGDNCWPPTEEYYSLSIRKYYDSDFQGSEWPFLLATPTLFAKNILVAKMTTYV